MTPVAQYLSAVKKNLAHGDATEHTYRPALKELLEALDPGVTATNEPQRKTDCGAPDVSLSRHKVPLGYIETKDVGVNLDEMERGKGAHGEQFKRYKDGLPNWILTDYLEFRWFVAGEKRLTARVADLAGEDKLRATPDGDVELERLFSTFFSHPALTVDSAKDLAQRMAGMAHNLRGLIVGTFAHGEPRDREWLQEWLEAFQAVLIPDLTEEQFADMFAQTLAYGLFAARINAPGDKPFAREMAAYCLPRTNPFLKKLFEEFAGVSLPETFSWAVDDLVQLLKHADLGKILSGFGKGKAKEDPVVHFYETFLGSYDPKMREIRGVYYTPEPVVSYIVRSVDSLLRSRFARANGLADENTLILDPAAGTATFLFFVIEEIHSQFEGQKGAWDSYVAEHLLNRIFGFELLMAPYAVAHLKLGMELQRTGYKFTSDQRLGVYLTNTLEEAAKRSEKLFARWISDEANAAAEIKRDRPILVVLGNPPYSGHSANRSEITVQLQPGDSYVVVSGGPLPEQKATKRLIAKKAKTIKVKTFIGQLMETYKEGCPELHKPAQAKWLQDDYVKFIRFAQWRIERTGHGILAFITNHGYLDNPTFRGMRQSLMRTFGDIYVYDLHGSSKKKERPPDGGQEENVFDIQQGVAILLAVKEQGKTGASCVYHADLWGERAHKYARLSSSDVSQTDWNALSPSEPLYLFVPDDATLRSEYEKGWSVPAIFSLNGDPAPGVVTTHDEFAIGFTKKEIEANVEALLASEDETAARQQFRLCSTTQWSYAEAKKHLAGGGWRSQVVPILYRPFDLRWTVFNRYVAVHRRERVMHHMLRRPNLGLVTARANRSPDKDHFLCSNHITETKCGESTIQSYLFPLYLYPKEDGEQGSLGDRPERQANLAPPFVEELTVLLGLRWTNEGLGDLLNTVGPEDAFHYAYAVFHSPTYRRRYSAFLKTEFPRLPLTREKKLFAALVEKGRELTALHLMESPSLDDFITQFPEKGDNLVEKAAYTTASSRVWINARQHFAGVPPEVWAFQVGGYQVCEKWLKDRKGRKLTYDDIRHYQRVIVALNETLRLMAEIDTLIPGWPLT